MRKSLFSFSTIAIAIMFVLSFGCNKSDDFLPDTGGQDVSFEIQNNSLLNKTKNGGGDIKCQDHLASYAKVVIDGQVQKISAFYVAGKLYTNTISLQPGNHIISDFLVYWDGGTTSTENDDVLISATPHAGSTFGSYVQNPLNIDFAVKADKKTAVLIEVLCYVPQDQASFGFVYFGAEEVIVRTMNFFGDFCIKSRTDYARSRYNEQTGWNSALGEYIDVPAIAKIEVLRKQGNGSWELQNTFSNSSQGETVKVTYGDYKNVTDSFQMKLYIYVKVGQDFVYKHFKTWMFKDAEEILTKTDSKGKTTYYVLGSCTPNANYIIPAYLNLPEVATYTITGAYAPGSKGGYVDAKLSNIGPGYDLPNGTYASFCADHLIDIYVGVDYRMDVYSSMYPDALPLYARQSKWAKINWLINHIGLEGSNNLYPGYNWSDLQGAIWLLEQPTPWNGHAYSGVPNVTPMMTLMAANANANYTGYEIPTGGWACVIFVPEGTDFNAKSAKVQTMFVRVDP